MAVGREVTRSHAAAPLMQTGTPPLDHAYDNQPCSTCHHTRWDHSWKGGCLAREKFSATGFCGCRITKGLRWAFGLRQSKGKEVLADG